MRAWGSNMDVVSHPRLVRGFDNPSDNKMATIENPRLWRTHPARVKMGKTYEVCFLPNLPVLFA